MLRPLLLILALMRWRGYRRMAGRCALYPRGSAPYPVVLAIAADGSIRVTDDRSRAILRIARAD